MTIYAIKEYGKNDYIYATQNTIKKELKKIIENENKTQMIYTISEDGSFKLYDRFVYHNKKWHSLKFKNIIDN